MGSVCCEHCPAVCCGYLALPLDPPETPRDFDDMRWYLMHEGVSVFVEEGDWYIQLATKCKKLRPDNLCGIYETRPKICREYKDGECDYVGGSYGYDELFLCPEDLASYIESKKTAKRNGKKAKKKTAKTARRRPHARR